MDKKDISAILNEIAVMLELLGANAFKVNAYYSAARTVELLEKDIGQLVESGEIRSVKGIGPSLSREISELVRTGISPLYLELKEQIPEGMFHLLRVPGLGPKKIFALNRNLGINTIEELEAACREKKLTGLSGFGEKTQENILRGIDQMKRFLGQYRYGDVIGQALFLEKTLREYPDTIRVQLAGSLRRCKEIVKDIDIVASSNDPEKLISYFTGLLPVQRVIGAGETKASVVLETGVGADLRVVSDQEYPYALHHFTGSKEHNTAMRHRAKQLGLKMNEYGLFDEDGINISCRDEKEIFQALKLEYIPPEIREDSGEIQAAEEGRLPRLVSLSDIKGVLHVHTKYSDGSASIEELADACRAAGWDYLGVSDHSRSAFYARGLNLEAVEKQLCEIDAINDREKSFTVFKGIEADILKDGSLDYPDEILASFDFVVASIHSGFKMTEAEATKRLIKAMSNPYVTILGHPTGRLLLGREGYPVDMKAIIEAALDFQVAIELNASPYRLDIDWRWCRYARERGVKIAINPDAHNPEELGHLFVGVGAARKGWLEPGDVINTMTGEELSKYFRAKK